MPRLPFPFASRKTANLWLMFFLLMWVFVFVRLVAVLTAGVAVETTLAAGASGAGVGLWEGGTGGTAGA
jgi:uncharacterized membrane protein